MSFIHVNGIRLHYEHMGSGPHVIMVHGLAANLAFWCLSIVPRLAGRFCITAYDLRGHGESDMPPSGYDRLSMCADLAALVNRFNIDHFHLIGHSFGGLVALEFVSSHPDRVRSLTLADVPLGNSGSSDRVAEQRHWNVMRKGLARAGISIPAQMPRIPYPLLQELAVRDMAPARQWRSSAQPLVPFGLWNGSSKSATRWLQLLRTTNALAEFDIPDTVSSQWARHFARPILLIVGERSRWIEASHILGDNLPNSRTVIIPNADHFHPLQWPEQFAQHVSDFLLGDGAA